MVEFIYKTTRGEVPQHIKDTVDEVMFACGIGASEIEPGADANWWRIRLHHNGISESITVWHEGSCEHRLVEAAQILLYPSADRLLRERRRRIAEATEKKP